MAVEKALSISRDTIKTNIEKKRPHTMGIYLVITAFR